MLRKILPILLPVIGIAAGAGGGVFLRPAAKPAETAAAPASAKGSPTAVHDAKTQAAAKATNPAGAGHAQASAGSKPKSADGREYVKLNNQFIVPVLKGGKVTSMIILSLSIEVTQGGRDQVYTMEPKLRDVFLSVLFDHANAGGFEGNFISGSNMVTLRDALKEAAVKTLGPIVSDVLILNLVRQDA